jgi:hypothetical protein
MPASAPAPELLTELGHLGPRDRLLLRLLADHHVLTTPQIHALLFASLRRAQRRLTVLHQAGFLDRFRDRQGRGGSQPWHWILGPLGLALARVSDDLGFDCPFVLVGWVAVGGSGV